MWNYTFIEWPIYIVHVNELQLQLTKKILHYHHHMIQYVHVQYLESTTLKWMRRTPSQVTMYSCVHGHIFYHCHVKCLRNWMTPGRDQRTYQPSFGSSWKSKPIDDFLWGSGQLAPRPQPQLPARKRTTVLVIRNDLAMTTSDQRLSIINLEDLETMFT